MAPMCFLSCAHEKYNRVLTFLESFIDEDESPMINIVAGTLQYFAEIMGEKRTK